MEHIELSDQTNRLRRNLMASAFLIIIIVYFHINVTNVTNQGVMFERLNTNVILTALVILMLYHAIAFSWLARADFKVWEIEYSRHTQPQGKDAGIIDSRIIQQFEKLEAAIQPNPTHGETVTRGFIKVDRYIQLIQYFPQSTKNRFLIWDIGVAGAITFIAFMFAMYGLGILWPNEWLANAPATAQG